MEGYNKAMLRYIFTLLLITQISADYGRKNPSSGRGPGPGPGGGRTALTGNPTPLLPVRTPLPTTAAASGATLAKTSNVTANRGRAAAAAQRRPSEVFFLHLDDGYFGCQVNESTDVLQLYDISKLCDGVSDCFLGSDENRGKLKCTGDCVLTEGARCQNGACLDHECHCNDGYGGCGCSTPDENECKYRPCDVFAQCTNTLGSFTCTCYPGYEGDGFTCTDIDECKDPALAAKCVENAECCNLPAHYSCKCKPGFEGDGEKECLDIDECQNPGSCGSNALCQNTPGNFTCTCPTGYGGNPYDGCADIDECELGNACGTGSICTNTDGGYKCACPPGFGGDPKIACVDVDECAPPPAGSKSAPVCGRSAICDNLPGTFRCQCPPGFKGDPKVACEDINECLGKPCGANATCTDTIGSFSCSCSQDFTGDPYRGCVDIDECAVLSSPCGKQAVCENAVPGFNCLCPQGYAAQPTPDVACEQVDVATDCKGNFDCVNNAECLDGQCFCRNGFTPSGPTCVDIDECLKAPCGPNSVCTNLAGSHRCECEAGFVGKPPTTPCKAPCEDVKCGTHATCKTQGDEAFCVCDEGWTYDPANIAAGCQDIDECDLAQGLLSRCGEGAICSNTPGSFSCQCPPGFSGDPSTRCLDIDECQRPGVCGTGAICVNIPGSHECRCPDGTAPEPDARTKCVSLLRCAIDDDCPGNAVCDPTKECLCPEPNVGKDCRHPCESVRCSANQECMLINDVAKCMCSSGFTGGPNGGCVDIDECSTGQQPCAQGAVCRNEPGRFVCECPNGFEGEPYKAGCIEKATAPPGCSAKNPCPSGEVCVPSDSPTSSGGVCVCSRGWVRDQVTGLCRDINECLESPADKPACGFRAVCKNLPGSYDCSCPDGYEGNPFQSCDVCDSVECRCQPPYKVVGGACLLADCAGGRQTCPSGAECITVTGGVSYCACPSGFRARPDGSCEDVNECQEGINGQPACGFGAECFNRPGRFDCQCPGNFSGDPYKGVCAPSQVRCVSDTECGTNERCVQPGECVCPPPYYTDTEDANKCKSPCERHACGVNSKCTPSDPPKCMCEPGHTGNPTVGCSDIDECRDNPCGPGALCINENGGFKCRCPTGLLGDAYQDGCRGEARSECSEDDDCDGQLACIQGGCVNPCQALPCGANAYCEPEEHAAWCRCLPGFKEDSKTGACISLCQDILCGENAQCVVSSATSQGGTSTTCACLEGYNGNPFPGGSCSPDVCSASLPCQEPQVCVSGRCKERCEGVTCGVGAKCDKATNQCVCLPFFIGKPDLLCVPPVVPPVCQPPCGRNSHCEYGQPNRCVCHPGTSGNPYESCGAQERTCDATKCGVNAECRQGVNRVDCVCPVGYQGNPYVACEDVNECIGNACGANAVCLNTPGSYDCRCQEDFSGNPFMMCMPISLQPPVQPNVVDPCLTVKCGPNAACRNGQCICLPGYSATGGGQCSIPSCRNDLDCSSREVCLPVDQSVKNGGVRRCVDACSREQCGPNAVCVADAHRASCICRDGFQGNANNLAVGCQPEPAGDKCGRDDECPGDSICGKDIDGIRQCVDPCKSFTCAQSEICVIKASKAHCECLTNFVRNPATGSCEKPGLPDCVTNADCKSDSVCRPDVLGVRKCTAVCAGYTCSANSDCRAANHVGQCVCRAGFTGNPNDRNGCRSVPKDQCQTDAQCSEVEACKPDSTGVRRCVPICPSVRCGNGAVCVANNHAAKCACPTTGLYAGDPSGPQGCRKVECLANGDCPGTKSCDRTTYTCKPVCVANSCGKNAICLAENHMAMCSCPAGLEPNPHPEIECVPADLCTSQPCHASAICSMSAGRVVCSCPLDRIGDPYRTGCRANGTCPSGNGDCPAEAACLDGRCVNPCDGFCGPNAACRVVNHRPSCSCPPRFNPNPTADRGCVRQAQSCRSDGDCPAGSPCMGGQCKAVCRNALDCAEGERCVSSMCQLPCLSNEQCPNGQACVTGFCRAGCRSNSDCPINQACLNHRCESPCQREGVCGLNALCRVIDRSAQCACPDGFVGGPTAQQGCMRNPVYCQSGTACPAGMSCQSGRCYPTCREGSNSCVGGERCLGGNCVKICYSDNNCMPGEVCIDGGCRPGCRSDTDCSNSQVCRNSQCRCAPGYAPGPNGNCVDVDECQSKSCHPTAQCINTPGSFRCSCRQGTVGDGYTEPCVAANQCETSAGCADQLACLVRQGGAKACADPCATTTCGPNALCTVVDHQPSCSCPPATRGNPNDAKLGCFRVDCIENEDCPQDRTCDKQSFKCINPCDSMECYNGLCQVKNRKAICQCAPGFRPSSDNKCVDVDECSTNPCHPSAICRNTPGNFQCVCADGLVGEPYKGGCKRPGQCVADSDCPLTASCVSGTCKDPCGLTGACGKGSDCVTENHLPVCRCPFQTTGNPKIECYTLQCVDGSDCGPKEACVNNKCVDPCAASNACGSNSVCSAVNHRAVCECKSGFTGSPYQGCVALVLCASEAQCPTSQTCAGGVCVSRCQSSRDCLPSQQCIEGKCRPACTDNSQCSDGQICANSVCVQEVRCRSDQECDDGQSCLKSNNGQAECRNPCDGAVLCGRNAICRVANRQAVCTCKEGFFGNPQDDKIGCLKIECSKNEDCSTDKRCHENRCKIACMVDNQCGKNTLCFSEKHQSVCKCQPGYTGNVVSGCTAIDYCSQTPCAAGARCENTRGSYKCFCPAGTVGEPYGEGCQQPVECRQNQDCPKSAVCGRERGQPKCQDVCAGFSCGPNSDCLPANHKATCVCRQGFQGNAGDIKSVGCVRKPVSCQAQPDCPPNTFCYGGICKPACQSSVECQDAEACVRGQCVNPCAVDGFCGMNAQCRAENHEAICSCSAGFTGSPKTECIRVPVACRRDGDCENGNRCTEGRCIPLCSGDSQCAINEKCVSGTCMLTCRVDNDCFLSHICLNNMCTIGCRQNSDCATDEACINSRCKNPCSVDSVCGPNALCNVVNQRAQCTCPAGFLAYPTPNTACVREPTPCTGTKSCAAGFTCQNSVCRPLCSADTQCLVNERCSQGMCVPVCRQDTDCSSGEICSMGMCKIGCRTDPDCPMTHACLNAQCVSVCASPAACGTNAKCLGSNHRAQCSCLDGLVGNAKVACRYPPSTCTGAGECLANQKCIGGMCRPGCANDQGCLSDSRCINGVCSPVCNSDAFCDRGHICLDRVCVVGCRNDATCPASQACVNNKCTDPCRVPNVCGNCAVCEVINHAAQCTCPAGSIGNPQVGCAITPTRCAANGDCSSGTCNSGFCSKSCARNNECSCGESCVQGRCRLKCAADNQCPTGQLCRIGSCAAGCKANTDCAVEQACINGQCKDPCQISPCGRGAECRISDHRAVCLCPSGYSGNPSVKCEKNECDKDKDCDMDKRCQNNRCILPCLEPNACGVNANCRAVAHKAQCLCSPGYYGNAQVECKQDVNECLSNPCGANAICTDGVGSFTCKCQPGCMGDPVRGCLCTAPSTIDPCADSGCGTKAQCRVEGTRPVCFCPPSYPSGNPRVECTVEPRSPDCRTEGCGEGASCVVQGSVYACRCLTGLQGNPDVRCSADRSCSTDNDCPMDKSCVQRQCQDPCSLREACGQNALCSVVLHKARCSCPQCYIGRPTLKCLPDPRCGTTTQRPVAVITTPRSPVTTARPPTLPIASVCARDSQCSPNHACNTNLGACQDPCDFKNVACDQGKRCEVRRHRPVCVCKHGFVLNDAGEMTCGPNPIECRVDDECASNLACVAGRCQNPCAGTRNPCAASNKVCQVLDHRAVCICVEDCTASVSICLRDRGCPPTMACVNYQCRNPCENSTCPENRPCYVEEHKAVCKFCPPGFVVNPQYGCIQAVGCRSDSECAGKEGCVNGRCQEPVVPKEPVVGECPPCKANEECDATTLTCFPVVVGECQSNNDCPYDRYCDRPTAQCVPVCQTRVCGRLASCQAVSHNAVCSCLEGYTGNPREQCYQLAGCRSNSDCPSKEACINGQCTNPCRCGVGAICEIRDHNAICKCPSGTIGNPQTGCTSPVVSEPCNPNPCGPNADCNTGLTRNPICTCRPGFFGDPQSNRGCGPECTTNSECQPTQACINQKCRDPCPGACGLNAACRVTGHNPVCSCVPGYTGNPYANCGPIAVSPVITPTLAPPVSYPQQPARPGYKPECVLNSDCRPTMACVNQKCADPCPGVCGPNAVCKVTNHNPICSCVQGYQGDPTRSCSPRPAEPVVTEPVKAQPCNPSPCGPYAECRPVNNQAVCSCLPGYFGTPCRPECVASSDCPKNKACVNQKCVDPCPGVCGVGANCVVRDHNPICSCPRSMTGDPFVRCTEPVVVQPETTTLRPKDPCNPAPCGVGATCRAQGNSASCKCPPNYVGDPYSGCRPECVQNSDCPRDKSCANNRCVNPCPGVCGLNAECRVINHYPVCSCQSGYSGDASSACRPIPVESRPIEPVVSERPCVPSPCGPNSACREVSNQPVCSCQSGFVGVPPSCRPECSSNAECSQSLACINQRCRDPCPGVCGENAVCRVTNHNPICNCPRDLTGDPFVRCQPFPARPQEPVVQERPNPCIPSPCGPNSKCQVVSNQAQCGCQDGMIGTVPNCRPECVRNSDCPSNLACINQKCKDPCAGICGANTQCRVVGHNPVCSCKESHTGDPFRSCVPIQPVVSEPPKQTPNLCNPSPCGANAVCREQSGSAICQCLPEYFGDARQGCKPECVLNSDCASTQVCVNQKCRDPCPGLCGNNAECRVINHFASCYCPQGHTGNPLESCKIIPVEVVRPTQPTVAEKCQPCSPSPCGPYSVCREVDCRPACSCQATYLGVPPSCRPECLLNSDCESTQACINQKCKDPCAGICGQDAECRVINHNPICSCPRDKTGDPFVQCRPVPVVAPPVQPQITDPCVPSPCGPNSACQVVNDKATCGCLANMIGTAPNCRPECVVNSDCPSNRACVSQKCVDPCPGSCGFNADCRVANHQPVCACQPRFTGDPYSSCRPIPVVEPSVVQPPKSGCNPSPCGVNAECRDISGSPECICPPNYLGDPYSSCRPECVLNTDCPRDRTCVRNRCENPCTDACGTNAECRVANHVPVCVCKAGFSGNPFSSCAPTPVVGETPPSDRDDVCNPNPCGTNAECRGQGSGNVCVCLPGLLGDPYVACKPECVTNSDCSNSMACIAQKCRDPCPGACGVNARCQVVGHNPVCSCANGFTGDPFVRCQPRPAVIEPVVKPECEVDPDCQTTQACIEQRCLNPCIQRPGICAPNAECRVVQHRPVCVCAEGFTGNPQVQCLQAGCRADSDCPSTEACVNRQCKDPCVFETCGTNALCRVNIHRAQCFCPERHEGDPYRACRQPECLVDEDCPSTLACREKNCRDPCNCPPDTKCTVINHVPRCSCPAGYRGEPNTTRGCFLPEEPAVVKGGCTSDGECPSKHACFNGECVNPCTVIKPCGINAQCLVVDSLPLRTMTCQCLPGFFGNPNVECRSVPVEDPGCRSDDNCPDTQSCRNRQCVSPCAVANPCANNALCTVVGHQPKCTCPDDYSGNPNINCYLIPKADVECRSDTECPLDKACEQTVCQDPCVVRNPCGDNAVCRTQQHRPVCFCPDGWGGDPQHKCFRPECERDDDCPSDRACITGKCLNPCVFGGDQCGTNALCRVTLHRPQCYCPAGMQGNPTVICIPVGCQSHDDCASEEVCDRLNRVCVKVCETITCAPAATCTGKDHQAICDCPPGQRGNPFVRCIEDPPIVTASPPRPECRSDPDCPSKQVCINNKCADPCGVNPCGDTGQLCSVVDSTPLRTVVCQCPPDSFADANSRCISAVTGEPPSQISGCRADDECPADEACRNGVCESPCDCAPDSICRVVNRKPVCACPEGLTGDPLVACFKVGCQVDEECPGTHACVNGQCKHVCLPATCESGATCRGIQHKPVCECPPGTKGNPAAGCKAIGCTNTKDCPTDRACFNGFCTDPCSMPDACAVEQECKPFNHTAVCDCPPGFKGTPQTSCTRADIDIGCRADTDCPSLEACINRECKDPCGALKPCAPSAVCEVKPTSPYRTMVCVCPPGTSGYAAKECVKVAVPEVEEDPCVPTKGQIKMPNGACLCDPLRNLILAPNGTCICDPDKGLVEGPSGICVSPVLLPECVSNDDCPDDKYCNTTCRDPCAERVCYPNSECRAADHRAICACIRGHAFKDGESGCIPEPPPFRTDFPRPDIVVNCLADGVQVDIHIGTAGFDGVLYVKGHSKDENCRRVLDAKRDVGSIDYKVRFDTCGLVLENGEASFILVIQKHPKLMTFKAQAYQVRCVYDTPEKTVTVGFNVSMLTTAGTISNTGPPPVCTMKICLPSGQEVRSAVIGDTLMLKVEVQPIGIYGGFARSCYAVTDNNNTHLVTDENGCPTDPTIFGAWTQNPETRTLVSSFNAFKFPASDNIRFQCNIRVCFGRCQPVNCDGSDAYGRRRRRQADVENLTPRTTNLTEVEIRESVIAGQLREEIMVQSNSILALDRGGEERFSAPTEAPDVVRQEVCVSTMGFIIALIITALLALVAVAVAVSCWLMAYRRRPKIDGPLPHPAEFPNPLFTTPEPLAEPSPDYLS